MSYQDSFIKKGLTLLLLFVAITCRTQSLNYTEDNFDYKGFHFEKTRQKKMTLDFTLQNNLIILPIKINQSDTLNFILDTGAGHTLITDPQIAKSLDLPRIRNITIQGIQKDHNIGAYISNIDIMNLSSITSSKHGVLVVDEDVLHLSEYAGIRIHGLLGYDIFSKFIVKIDYELKRVVFYNPEKFRSKAKGERLAIKFHQQKPYVQANVIVDDSQKVEVDLIVDLGAGHALSLEQHTGTSIKIPEKSIKTYLGTTLAGSVYGSLARIKGLELGSYKLENILTSFPDSTWFVYKIPEREGNLGNDVLKRFDLVIDYPHSQLFLKPNSYFKNPFYTNSSGIYFLAEAPDYKTYKISYISPSSPAEKAGLEIGDVLIAVNNEMAANAEMGRLYKQFEKKSGSRIRVFVRRENMFLMAEVFLENKL